MGNASFEFFSVVHGDRTVQSEIFAIIPTKNKPISIQEDYID